MANFEPKWDLRADTNSIKEGQTTYFRLRISKSQTTSPNNEYVLQDDQYLEFTFNIVGAGETLEERDFNVSIGESTSSLVPIGEAGTGTPHIQGKHVVKLSRKDFQLSSSVTFIDAFFFKIECPEDGIWDGPESLTFNIDSINEITLLDGQIANTMPSGVLGTSTQVLNYNTAGEIWLTPNLTTHGDNLYTIGGIGYGAESRLFIQAFGQSRTINGVTNVFMPSYEVQDITMSDIPSEHITGSGTILVPDESALPSIPEYPITLGTTRNQINSFYMKNVANLMSGAGCIIQGTTLTDHNNELYYSYGIRVYANTGFKLMCPAEAESIYVSNVNAVNAGGINSSLSELTEYGILDTNKIGRCDIYGNVKHEPQTIVLPPSTTGGQMVIYIRVKVSNTICPPWISFNVISFNSPILKSSNTLDNRIYINTNSTALNSVELDNILHAAVAGSGWTTSYNANNTKNQVPNTIEPVVIRKLEENSIMIRDEIGNMVQSGLKFNANGQFVQTFIYDSEPVDAYFRATILSIKDFYNTDTDAYYVGKRFRAYNVWVCPADVTNFSTKPKPGHLYQLKDTKVYPYVVKDTVVEGITKILFEEDKWYDLGLYNESLGANIIGSERMFRIVVNDDTGTDISFETDSNLGEIHVGEYFGHTVYPKIVATGSELITYTINASTSPNDITKYGIDLTADGFIVGEAYALSTDFSANDDIPLQFDVVATGKNGKSLTQRFKIRIIRGLGQNFLHADICPSLSLERAWFRMISTTSFSRANYYRASDPRYGVKKVPRILMKENFVDPNKNWEGIKQTVLNIRNGIVDTEHGAPTPDGSFRLVLGNYKLRSALDNQGNVLYDVLYRELHSEGTQVSLSLNPLKYTDYSTSLISEIYGLRQNVYNIVGEDTVNLLTDPTDLNNRGIVVDPINGLSVEMLDTVPRYMNHPYVEDNIKPMYFPCIPVAYLQPGQGEVFFNTLIQNNEHGTLLNTEFEVSGVEFSYFVQDNERYVPETFMASLRVPNLFQ
ncbi:putative structural protein [Erwinia phage pEa_SNUABM_50]|uniref:Putative structural protein n=2 Tax=Eneladusvirus BF TaxID=2560751 RepID=A0A7L8ZPC4_9CAUD|nr:putative structural protein [Erwinia phage pEa_SNUABM_12]QOI72344.1 putative structural protein [Erwinia phage pEa_SNUABM_50]QXO11470.1 hypothetical protein pEaSNUABM19_00324 [Erwinia phage pEa_SNUABM_19]